MNINLVKGFTQKTCGSCGVIFFIPDELEKECQETGQSWHCPNGHSRVYKESQASKYKRLYEEECIRKQNAHNARQEAERIADELKTKLEAMNKAKKVKKAK